MKSDWSYFNPVRILYGSNSRNTLVDDIKNQKCLVISSERGRKMFCDDEVLCLLEKNNELCWIDKVHSNPDIVDIQNIIDQLKGKSFNSIIAFGGGSVMDSAKAINLALCKELHEYSLAELISDPRIHNNVTPPHFTQYQLLLAPEVK